MLSIYFFLKLLRNILPQKNNHHPTGPSYKNKQIQMQTEMPMQKKKKKKN